MAVPAGDRALGPFHPYSNDTGVDMLQPAHLTAVEGTTAGQAHDRVSEFGAFGDLVGVDTQGRAHRDDGKFLSNYELDQIAAHQDQIRHGMQELADKRAAQERRRLKLIGLYGISNYHERYRPRLPLTEPESSIPEADLLLALARRTPQQVALAAFEAPERPLAPPPKERGWLHRTGSRLREWWGYDADTIDKGVVVLGAVAVAAAVAIIATHHDIPSPESARPSDVPASTAPVSPNQLQVRAPALPRSAPGPSDVIVPAGLTLKQQAQGDSIWHEVATSIRVDGHRLTDPQVARVTAQIMRDNHIRSERQAEHLPVGFKAHISHAVQHLVHSFVKQP